MPTVETKLFDYGRKEMEYLTSTESVLGAAMACLGQVEREVIPELFAAALVYAAVGQLVSVRSVKTVWNRMQEAFGGITPKNISSFSADNIQSCGMTMKKAVCISDLSRDIVQGKIRLDEL